jgi:hypothetical protein
MDAARWRSLLGYGGLLPFAGLALLAWLAPPAVARLAITAQVGYGAVILAFVGALHWGRALAADEPGAPVHSDAGRGSRAAGGGGALLWSVMPSLWAWAASLLAPRVALLALAAGLVLAWAVDQRLYAEDRDRRWHAGFLRLRALLTAVATLALLASAAAPAAA